MIRRRCSRLIGFERQAQFVGDGDGLAFAGGHRVGGAVLEFQLFGAAQGHLQSVGQVVGNVVAADGQHAGVFDDAVAIDGVIGRPAADVNDQRAEFLLFVGRAAPGRRPGR